jgi:alkanesulfonate monooxygenase SsuD/methylene tetrahydromethanopterin reductase-like flavin-dependent oxidoreductase (luciferase family)
VTEAALGYHAYGDYIAGAEAFGYSSIWLVEHHFTGFSQLSATLNYVSYLCGRTSKIRLGTAVTVVPWHNPILLAEQVATIDQLSKGRFDFGVGKGYRYNEFHGFNIDPNAATAMYEESMEIIKRAFTQKERWSYKSDKWQFNDVIVEPPVVQKPHPPIWVGAGSEASIRKAAQDGYNLLLDQIVSFEAIGERVAIYRDEIESLGRTYDPYSIAVTRGLMAARDDAERDFKHAFRGKFITGVQVLSTDPKMQARAYAPRDGRATDPREISEKGAVIGDTQEMIDRLGRLYDAGVRNVLLHDLLGSHETLQLVAEEVMPHFVNTADARPVGKAAAE